MEERPFLLILGNVKFPIVQYRLKVLSHSQCSQYERVNILILSCMEALLQAKAHEN